MAKALRGASFAAAFVMLAVFILAPYTAYAQSTYTPSVEISSSAVYMADTSGNVLYEQNADQRMYPAELTQIMTAIIVIENIDGVGGWEAEATFTASMQNYLYENRGATVLTGLAAGEVLSADQLFHAMVIASGYDAAMALAGLICDGDQDAFVELMNAKARELGASDTNFTNCHGLHDTAHYTTAHDMYLIANYAMTLDKFVETVALRSYNSGPTSYNENLLWNTDNGLMASGNVHYYAPVTGIKAGYTQEAGRNIVSSASQDGFTYIQVDMGAPYELKDDTYNLALVDAKNLYMWAFTEFQVKTVVEYGEQIGEVPLELAWEKDYLQLMVGERYVALLPSSVDVSSITYEYDLPEYVEAPVEKGDEIGTLKLVSAGEVIGSVPLLAAESVAMSEGLYALNAALEMTRSFWFKFIVVLIIVIIGLYITLMIVRNRNRRKYGNIRHNKKI